MVDSLIGVVAATERSLILNDVCLTIVMSLQMLYRRFQIAKLYAFAVVVCTLMTSSKIPLPRANIDGMNPTYMIEERLWIVHKGCFPWKELDKRETEVEECRAIEDERDKTDWFPM